VVCLWRSREKLELETQLDAAMRSRRVGSSRSDTQITTAQLQALELHNTNLQVTAVCLSVCGIGMLLLVILYLIIITYNVRGMNNTLEHFKQSPKTFLLS